jgi:hypothetical protein
MSNGDLADAIETFSAPIEHFITALGQGIAEAQRALDLNSLQTQEVLDTDPQTAQLGLQATWYQFPRVDLELKLAISMAQSGSAPALGFNPLLLRASTRIIAQPVSAAYQTHFSYDGQAASTLSLSIVPVPPPRSGAGAAIPPLMTSAQVTTAAITSAAADPNGVPVKFATVQDAQGHPAPDPTLRFDVNFNGAVRLWYVLQYPAGGATAAVVSVDDATGFVRGISAAA